jgi:acetyl-CoA C-acetyltransferase
MRDVVLVGSVRTAIGKFGGYLRNIKAEDLAAITIREVINRCKISPEEIDTVIMGQTRQSTRANNLARVAILKTDIPYTAKAYTINMLCGSGMRAIISGAMEIILNQSEVVLAGGTENMSESPYYIRNARFGDKTPDFIDSNIEGGLGAVPMDIYGDKLSMGITAENVAKRYHITREEQDLFAYNSQMKYAKALEKDVFSEEIVPVEIKTKKETILFDKDEFPRIDTTLEKLAKLKPVFDAGGTVTAGNSCGRNDGAASVVLMSGAKAEEYGIKPIARLVAWGEAGVEAEYMGIGPVNATRNALKQTSLSIDDIDVIELNEAFASQSIACINELGLDINKVNPNGGAIALGHPLGCTGARLVTTLVHEMDRKKARYGLATQCIGGGQGIATIWELL